MTTGETERALRTDIAGAVARGWCTPVNATKVMDVDLANAITAELLTAFQRFAEQPKCVQCQIKAMLSRPSDAWLEEFVKPLKEACDRNWTNETPEQVLVIAANGIWWRLKPATDRQIEQAVAGAYAAAAKVVDDYELLDGKDFHVKYYGEVDLAPAIRALTPADARQAQQHGKLELWHLLFPEGTDKADFESGDIADWIDTFADEVEAHYRKLEHANHGAAIASAEARARLESENEHFGEVELLKAQVERLDKLAKHWENDRDLWKQEHIMYRGAWLREIGGVIVRKTHEIDGFVLRTREVYEAAEKWWAHEKELSAASTPDSTKEQE